MKIPSVNKLILNILACGIVFSSPAFAEDISYIAPPNKKATNQKKKEEASWNRFVAQDSGFSVDLPAQPEYVDQVIEIPKTDLKIAYETYLSEPNESVVYVISIWDYPKEIDMSKPEVNLQDGFGGMLSALPGSEVLDMKMSEVQGFQSLEFLVKNDNIYFHGELILVHNTLYQVFAVYKDSEEMEENYEHFINSFTLIDPDKKAVAPIDPQDTAKDKKATKKMSVSF